MITSSTVQGTGLGTKRTCIVANEKGKEMGKIEEGIVSFDESAKTYSYTITISPFPVENYVGTVMVTDLSNDTSELEWSSKCEAKGMPEEEVHKMLQGVYSSILSELKKMYA